jgi:uncharacterized protein YacL
MIKELLIAANIGMPCEKTFNIWEKCGMIKNYIENFILGLMGILISLLILTLLATALYVCYIISPVILVVIGIFVIVPLLGKLVIQMTKW